MKWNAIFAREQKRRKHAKDKCVYPFIGRDDVQPVKRRNILTRHRAQDKNKDAPEQSWGKSFGIGFQCVM